MLHKKRPYQSGHFFSLSCNINGEVVVLADAVDVMKDKEIVQYSEVSSSVFHIESDEAKVEV